MILTDGLNFIRNRMLNTQTSTIGFAGVGKGTTAAAAAQTVLFNETYPTTSRRVPTIGAGDYNVGYEAIYEKTELNNTTIAESGLFTGNTTTGTVVVRRSHPDIPKKSTMVVTEYVTLVVTSVTPGGIRGSGDAGWSP